VNVRMEPNMASESPVILVELPYCYLPYDHGVRKQARKLELSEVRRHRCKAARLTAPGGRGNDD